MATTDSPVVSAALSAELLAISKPVSKSKGTVLFRRGDPCAGVFLIRKGKVRLFLDNSEAVFGSRILGPGSVVGLPAAVAGTPYSLSADIVENAELACVPQKALADCLRRDPILCFEVMEILSNEISQTRCAIKNSGDHHSNQAS